MLNYFNFDSVLSSIVFRQKTDASNESSLRIYMASVIEQARAGSRCAHWAPILEQADDIFLRLSKECSRSPEVAVRESLVLIANLKVPECH